MEYLSIFSFDKEKSFSSLMVYSEDWRNYEFLKFWFCKKIIIFTKTKKKIKFPKNQGKCGIRIDICITKKKVFLREQFIFKTNEDMRL